MKYLKTYEITLYEKTINMLNNIDSIILNILKYLGHDIIIDDEIIFAYKNKYKISKITISTVTPQTGGRYRNLNATPKEKTFLELKTFKNKFYINHPLTDILSVPQAEKLLNYIKIKYPEEYNITINSNKYNI